MPADPVLDPVQPASASPTAFVGAAAHGPVDTPVRVSSWADYRSTFGGAGEPGVLDRSVELFFANGGTDAVVVRAAGPAADEVVPAAGRGGLSALAEPFTVLVLPGLTSEHSRAVEQALTRCEQERAVLLLDLPVDADARTAALLADRVRGARGRVAAYHPWVVVGTSARPDGSATGGHAVPPSGAVAGVVASTPAGRGLGRTPMGGEAELRGVDGLAADLTGDESELLTVHGVNALRILPDRRRVVWGGRLLAATASSEPSARYLAVRRLTDHVLTSLEQGMEFVAQRRTDPGVAELVRRRAEDFLTGVWRQGALAGRTQQEAFFVRCDGTTTTRADLAAGRLVLLVGLATTRPAEFEVHRLLLETASARGPQIHPSPVAVARAAEMARERGTVVRRVHLAPLVTGDRTEDQLSTLFERAASAGTVLLLEEADGVLGRTDGRARRGALEVQRTLEQLSHDTGVPYVLAGRR